MPIVENRYYSDPNIGKAFSNLSGLFGPPSGADLAGYATAAAKKEEAARLAKAFSYAEDPNYNQAQADRLGVLAGLYAPNQSYYSVDQGNLTARRGQDIGAQTTLTANSADNARMLQQTQLTNQNAALLKTMDPLSEGQVQFRPPSIASLFGVPEQVNGMIAAQPGERITTPDGRLIEGAAKPLSEAEQKAAERQQLREGGLLTDQMIADTITGAQTPVTVMVDGKPRLMTPGEGTRLGAEPMVNRGAEAKPTAYKTLDGRMGMAISGPDGRMIDTQTKEVLPAGTVPYNINVQGTADETGMSTRTNQTSATAIQAQVEYGLQRVQEFKKLLAENPGVIGMPGMISGFAQDLRAGIGELTAQYGDQIPGFKSMADMDAFLAKATAGKNYDPNIRRAQALASELAYIAAKAADPSGEVNVREWERLAAQFDGGVAGNEAALAAVQELENSLKTRLSVQVPLLRNPGGEAQQTGDPLEGKTATNPTTGQKIIRRNGQWVPQ